MYTFIHRYTYIQTFSVLQNSQSLALRAVLLSVVDEIAAVTDGLRNFADAEVLPRHEANRDFSSKRAGYTTKTVGFPLN